MKVLLLLLALVLPTPSTTANEPTAREVLATWDASRSEAWAAGDVRRLRSLYTPGSVAGLHDVAMLRQWRDRGLVVAGLRMQVLSLREISRTDDRLVLEVVDRVVGATAGGQSLPRDGPTAHTVVLQQVDGTWLVSAVR